MCFEKYRLLYTRRKIEIVAEWVFKQSTIESEIDVTFASHWTGAGHRFTARGRRLPAGRKAHF